MALKGTIHLMPTVKGMKTSSNLRHPKRGLCFLPH